MKNLFIIIVGMVISYSASAEFLAGDRNGNGRIDHGNSGEIGSLYSGNHCAPGLTAWGYDAKTGHFYSSDSGWSQTGYMCWNARCVGDGQTVVMYNSLGFQPRCCPGTSIKGFYNSIDGTGVACCSPGSTKGFCGTRY